MESGMPMVCSMWMNDDIDHFIANISRDFSFSGIRKKNCFVAINLISTAVKHVEWNSGILFCLCRILIDSNKKLLKLNSDRNCSLDIESTLKSIENIWDNCQMINTYTFIGLLFVVCFAKILSHKTFVSN